jgi:hypothetical protein
MQRGRYIYVGAAGGRGLSEATGLGYSEENTNLAAGQKSARSAQFCRNFMPKNTSV